MNIPVDGQDTSLPDDVVAITKREDLLGFQEIPKGSFVTVPSDRLTNFRSSALLTGLPQAFDEPSGFLSESTRVPRLENWTVQAHAYSSEVAGKIGLFGRLFGGDVKRAKVGVIHEAKRFTSERTDEGRQTEIGVAVRIFAATTDWDASIQLTLPNVAADAQLHARDARVSIDVVGYSGPLGSLLPAPQRLDVESLATYLTAFHAIQATVFGEAGLSFLTPTVLSYEEEPEPKS